jgi:hypothetical protein
MKTFNLFFYANIVNCNWRINNSNAEFNYREGGIIMSRYGSKGVVLIYVTIHCSLGKNSFYAKFVFKVKWGWGLNFKNSDVFQFTIFF